MFRSRWISAIAFGLILIPLFIWGGYRSWHSFTAYQIEHAEERESQGKWDTETAQHGEIACNSIVINGGFADWLSCLIKYVDTKAKTKQSEYDLKAQQDMAEWAFGMLIVTIWLSVITLFGVIFVWQTLRATREMTLDTRNIGEAQTRAYLVFDGGAFELSNGTFRAQVFMKNVGQSPSKNLTCQWSMTFSDGTSIHNSHTSSNFNSFDVAIMSSGRESFKLRDATSKNTILIQDYRFCSLVFLDMEISWIDVFDKSQTIFIRASGQVSEIVPVDPVEDNVAVFGGSLELVSTKTDQSQKED